LSKDKEQGLLYMFQEMPVSIISNILQKVFSNQFYYAVKLI